MSRKLQNCFRFRTVLVVLSLGAQGWLTLPARAQTPSSEQELRLRIESLESTVSELQSRPTERADEAWIVSPHSPPAGDLKHAIIGPQATTYKAGGATRPPQEPDKKSSPTVHLSGFTQLVGARFGQDELSRATLGDIEDGLGFRRARLAATGSIALNTSYMFEFDLAQAQATFVDMWGQFDDTPFGQVRIGRFRQPFGMSELMGIRDQPFIERPVSFSLAPFRQTGIMFSDTTLDDTVTWAASGFRTTSDNFGNVYGDDGGYGTAIRLTTLLIDGGGNRVFHVGGDYSYLDPARNQLQIATQDETFLSQNPNFGPGALDRSPTPPFQQIVFTPAAVNTGVFSVEHANLYNLEAAVGLGRTVFQSEVRWGDYELPGVGVVTIPAFYADARFMLTGEEIPYNRKAGVFGRPKPDCPFSFADGSVGAWEINAQVSHIDASDFFGQPNVTGPGRRLTTLTSGLVWYLNAHAKSHLQYAHGILEDQTRGESDLHTLASMIQFDF